MKRSPISPPEPAAAGSILAFGAHPDDIEFGCGGIVARETSEGRAVHFAVCSRGEAASHGTPASRGAEAGRAAGILGATLEFVDLDGDGRLEMRAANARALAAVIRRVRPGIVLAPTPVENQHPDHSRLGRLVRDAARLARYGGVAELREQPVHAVASLLFYAVTAEGEPPDAQPVLVDISSPATLAAWQAAMGAHGSQAASRPYAELQVARARVWGLRAGVGHAQPLFPNDPLIFHSLAALARSARCF